MNSSSGGVAVFVILMVGITLGAGYLYSKNEDLYDKERVAHQGMEEVVQRYEDLVEAKKKADAENVQLRAQLETAQKELDAMRLKSTELTTMYEQEHQAYLAAEEARQSLDEELNTRSRAQVVNPRLLQKVEENPSPSQRARERNKSAAPAQLSASLDSLLPFSVSPGVLTASILGMLVFAVVLFASYRLVRGEAKPVPTNADFFEDREIHPVIQVREEAAALPQEQIQKITPAKPQTNLPGITLEPSWDRRKGLLRKVGPVRQ